MCSVGRGGPEIVYDDDLCELITSLLTIYAVGLKTEEEPSSETQ
jgi:hypothetical protein